MNHKDHMLSIYNSLKGEKEPFIPISPGFVGMYVCGPTVYSNVHLGNVRTFMSFDMVYRYLRHIGYKVRYVRNITDVGHIVADADQGEDKIARMARLEQIEPMEVVQRYTVDFHKVLQQFNLLHPSIEPTATGHIIEQIVNIGKMIERGYAYEANGSVYFDVARHDREFGYGTLSRRDLADMAGNSRALEGQDDKRNTQDFALWKRAEEGHLMRWPSPWGEGFPGWHTECAAMSTKYLGDRFDIHGGGMDLKFPHHDCEIAQGEACTGHQPVNYWMHANLLTLNGKKMAKSTGNNILPGEVLSGESPLLSKAYPASVVRLLMMQTHYRGIMDFSDAALLAAEKGHSRLMGALGELPMLQPADSSTIAIAEWEENCYKAMDDDFNTPVLISHLFEGIRFISLIRHQKASLTAQDLERFIMLLHGFVYDVLGLSVEETAPAGHGEKLDGTIALLMDIREQARADRNWVFADDIRQKLMQLGIHMEDGPDGPAYRY